MGCLGSAISFSFFELVGMQPLNPPMVWQGMGMVIGVCGLGYWWAIGSSSNINDMGRQNMYQTSKKAYYCSH